MTEDRRQAVREIVHTVSARISEAKLEMFSTSATKIILSPGVRRNLTSLLMEVKTQIATPSDQTILSQIHGLAIEESLFMPDDRAVMPDRNGKVVTVIDLTPGPSWG